MQRTNHSILVLAIRPQQAHQLQARLLGEILQAGDEGLALDLQ
jgi:hypothetical protein